MKITVFEYDLKKETFHYVGWAVTPSTFFKMMDWKVPQPEHERLLIESGKLYICRHIEGKTGTYHWTKEGLLSELREIGIIS